MLRSAEERLAQLEALPPTTHVSFQQRQFASGRRVCWYATWRDRATGKAVTLYLGKEPPDHPCLGGHCTHPFRHHQPKKPPSGRVGPPIGYRPGPDAIERMRQAHLGKRRKPLPAPQEQDSAP